jgi:hypothetical protein
MITSLCALAVTASVVLAQVGSGSPGPLGVEFDDDLFTSTLPSVMEVGSPYEISMRIANSGTEKGQFFVLLWSETSAIHPQLSNQAFLLRPGEVAKANVTLVGVRPTDEPQVVRAMVYGTPGDGFPSLKMVQVDGLVQRIEPSGILPSLALLVLIIVLVAVTVGVIARGSALAGIRRRRSESPESVA